MKILFIAILFANAAFGISLFAISLQKQNREDQGREMLTFNTVASIIWSLGAGLLIVQTNEMGAHLARLVGLLGTLLYMMPEMDGEEAMKEIRKLSEYYQNQCKIVVLTANAIDGIQHTLIASGFDDYLSKPINYAAFEKVLKKFIPADKISQ